MWLRRFEKTRFRLYWISIVIVIVFFGVEITAAVLGSAVEPLWDIPTRIAAFFAPGLPANLVDIAMKFPYPVFISFFALMVTLWVSRRVQVDENEYAFQRWRSVLQAPAEVQSGPVAKPPRPVRIIACFASAVSSALLLSSVLAFLAVLVFGIYFAFFSCCNPDSLLSDAGSPSTKASEERHSAEIVYPRQLSSGETVTVMVAASRQHNETGILLEAGDVYTAEYVSHERWKDGDFEADRFGVEYEGLTQLLAWGTEWLRPYPEGKWFQVVGRIDGIGKAFPVLGADRDDCQAYKFVAPRDGQLVLLVNDVRFGNNSGWMTIEIGRPVSAGDPACAAAPTGDNGEAAPSEEFPQGPHAAEA